MELTDFAMKKDAAAASAKHSNVQPGMITLTYKVFDRETGLSTVIEENHTVVDVQAQIADLQNKIDSLEALLVDGAK